MEFARYAELGITCTLPLRARRISLPAHEKSSSSISRSDSARAIGGGLAGREIFLSASVRKIAEAGLRSQVKIICGGPAVDPRAARRMGADDASDDAWEAVGKMDRLVGELRSAK